MLAALAAVLAQALIFANNRGDPGLGSGEPAAARGAGAAVSCAAGLAGVDEQLRERQATPLCRVDRSDPEPGDIDMAAAWTHCGDFCKLWPGDGACLVDCV